MRPEDFVKKVVTQYINGKGIFKNKINAEELIPDDLDDLGRALFIFYVLQLDYAMKSQILYKGAIKLYYENKKFFTPGYISKISDKSLIIFLKNYLHPRYINEAVKRFQLNTKVLAEKYSGDPRKISENT
jgi:hypothetical protein